MNLLIVDDDAMILHLLQMYLGEPLGHEICGVRSAKEAISAIRKRSFDLALIDLKLPDQSGFEVLRELRQQQGSRRLPVLIMTATQDLEVELEAFEKGANDFMRKPLDPRVVVARVSNLIRMCDMPSPVLPELSAKPAVPLDPDPAAVTLAPALANNDSATFYGTATLAAPMVPCEIPVLLIFTQTSLFCKTIKLGSNSMMVLVFNDLPRQDGFQLQLVHPNGETMSIQVQERERRPVGHAALGAVRLFLEVIQGDALYFELCSQMAHALRFHGATGLRDLLSGGSQTLSRIVTTKSEGQPKQVLRYRFIRLLGSGSIASVFLVRDLTLKRDVAMKVLNAELAANAGVRERFLSQAQLAAQFHHDNIVFLYEAGQFRREQALEVIDIPKGLEVKVTEFFVFITMHYVQGETLAAQIRDHLYLPVERSLTIFNDALAALSYAHGMGVIHGDIKPSNIMIDHQGQVVLTDFGIADLGEASDPTGLHVSPEQAQGQALDVRSDLYSLASTLYLMLTGVAPFTDTVAQKRIARQMNELPKPLLGRVKQLSPEVEKVVMRCLATHPEARFASAAAVLEAMVLTRASNPSGSKTDDGLGQLLAQVLRLDKEGDVVSLMDKLAVFLNTPGEGAHRERIAEPAVLDAILGRALHEEHFENLYAFFKSLLSSRAVFTLLRWFEREMWLARKAFIARLAVVCAGIETQPLAEYCTALADSHAILMLRAFADENVLRRKELVSCWAKHPGSQTRLELLRHLRQLDPWSDEELGAVRLLTNAGLPAVAQEATRMLATRGLTAQTEA